MTAADRNTGMHSCRFNMSAIFWILISALASIRLLNVIHDSVVVAGFVLFKPIRFFKNKEQKGEFLSLKKNILSLVSA